MVYVPQVGRVPPEIAWLQLAPAGVQLLVPAPATTVQANPEQARCVVPPVGVGVGVLVAVAPPGVGVRVGVLVGGLGVGVRVGVAVAPPAVDEMINVFFVLSALHVPQLLTAATHHLYVCPLVNV